jgi:hypothetical protein
MLIFIFFLLALFPSSIPAGLGSPDLLPDAAAFHELLPPRDTGSDSIPCEAIEENAEEEGEEEAVLCCSRHAIEELGPPSYSSDSRPCPFHLSPASRCQRLRGPPAR